MRAIGFQLRAELRVRWRSWLALGVLAGLLGGVLAATLACARRTDSVVGRYRRSSLAADVIVGNGANFGNQGLDLARVRRLPQVVASHRGMLLETDVRSRAGTDVSSWVFVEVNPGARGDERIDRPRLLAGRPPRADRPDEAIADRSALARLGVAVGDTVRIRLHEGRPERRGPIATIRIVAVRADLLSPGSSTFITVTPAFYLRHGGRQLALAATRNAVKVRLRRGSRDVPAFQREVERLARGRDFQFTPEDLEAAKLQSGFHLLAATLRVVTALGAAALLLLLGQAIARTIELETRRHPVLIALGMTRSQLAQLMLARVALIGCVGAVVAIPVTLALSPLTPVGRARDYEPHPGVAADLEALAAAVALALVVAAAPGLLAAARVRRASSARIEAGGAGTADTLAKAGLPPTCVAGIRMAGAGTRSATAAPARATMSVGIIAVAVAAATLTLSASLGHLLVTPRLSGLTWDYASYQGYGTERDVAEVRSDPAIAAASFGEEAVLSIGARRIGVAAFDPVKGTLAPTVLSGRAPTALGEVMLGARTFDAVHARLGAPIRLRRGGQSVRLIVVGRGVLPETNFLTLGEGAATRFGTLKRLVPGAFRSRLLLRIAPDADREAVLERLERTYYAARPGLPREVTDLAGVRRVPFALAVLVALAAAGTLVRTLLLSVHSRRGQLAILKTLGFTRGQVGATVAWHATAIAVVAAAAGLPLGVAAGRWAWNLVADHLGVAPEVVTPIPATLLVVPAVLLLVNVAAAVPARLAARTPPAVVLRAE